MGYPVTQGGMLFTCWFFFGFLGGYRGQYNSNIRYVCHNLQVLCPGIQVHRYSTVLNTVLLVC